MGTGSAIQASIGSERSTRVVLSSPACAAAADALEKEKTVASSRANE
jgi:hypothetical protein